METNKIYTGSDKIQTIEITILKTPFDFLNANNYFSDNTKTYVTDKELRNLYKAEAKRMNSLEKLGIDGNTKGRGQIGKPAYIDVKNMFSADYETYANNNQVKKTDNFYTDIKNPKLEDFLVVFYLGLCIQRRQKTGRPALDAAKFGIACYHGAWNTIVALQEKSKDQLSFSEIEDYLKNGNKKEKDLFNYINEVLYG